MQAILRIKILKFKATVRATGRSSKTAEAALFAAEIVHYTRKLLAREIRPQRRRKRKLGVARLPEQEIRQPLLAAGAHQQIHVAAVRGIQMRADARFALRDRKSVV